MVNKQVILILASSFSKELKNKYLEIAASTLGFCEVKILFHQKGTMDQRLMDLEIAVFTDDILHGAGYSPIGNSIVPGSNHFPVLQFYVKNPNYAYYWCIEDDVNFNGSWSDFFGSFSTDLTYDFISSHLRSYAQHPIWHWWQTLETPGKTITQEQLMLSFNPVYRISNAALYYLHTCMLQPGWKGHHEVLVPTLLKDAGFKIADLGSEGDETIPRLSFCTLNSMRWKPVHLVTGKERDMLYHPVKARISFTDILRYVKRRFQNNTSYFTVMLLVPFIL